MTQALAAFIAFVFSVVPGVVVAQPARERLEIVTASGSHPFDIELVRFESDMRRGLMFRTSLPADQGMLFDFRRPQPISMWMKNTYISLDMVFIGIDGRITRVAENAEPKSEAIIASETAALAVLELNAGTAKTIGAVPGDVVHASIFPKKP